MALKDPEPRLRLEAVLAIRQAGQVADCRTELLELAAGERDRLVYYAVWGALRAGQRKARLFPVSTLWGRMG